MGRANLIGKGSKETPEPEDVEGETETNVLGMEDRSTTRLSIGEAKKNTKPRRVSKTTVPAIPE